jgi:hypothetical protein
MFLPFIALNCKEWTCALLQKPVYATRVTFVVDGLPNSSAEVTSVMGQMSRYMQADAATLSALLTYLLTPWCRILLEKLIATQLVKKYPAFLRNPKAHYRVHKSRHRILTWASWIQFAPSIPLSLRSIFYPAETPNVPSTKSHVLFPLPRSCQRISPGPMRFETFRNNKKLRWGVVAPRPTPKLEDHPLSAVSGCLFNIFAANPLTRRTSLSPQPEDAPCHGDKGPI